MSCRNTTILTAALLLGVGSLARAQTAAPDSTHRVFPQKSNLAPDRRDIAQDRAERQKDDSMLARYNRELERKRQDLRVDKGTLDRSIQAMQRGLNAAHLDSAKVQTERATVDSLTTKVLADRGSLEHKEDQLNDMKKDIRHDTRGIKADRRDLRQDRRTDSLRAQH